MKSSYNIKIKIFEYTHKGDINPSLFYLFLKIKHFERYTLIAILAVVMCLL